MVCSWEETNAVSNTRWGFQDWSHCCNSRLRFLQRHYLTNFLLENWSKGLRLGTSSSFQRSRDLPWPWVSFRLVSCFPLLAGTRTANLSSHPPPPHPPATLVSTFLCAFFPACGLLSLLHPSLLIFPSCLWKSSTSLTSVSTEVLMSCRSHLK